MTKGKVVYKDKAGNRLYDDGKTLLGTNTKGEILRKKDLRSLAIETKKYKW